MRYQACLLLIGLCCLPQAVSASFVPRFETVWQKEQFSRKEPGNDELNASWRDQISYSVGVSIARDLQKQKLAFRSGEIERAIRDVVMARAPSLSDTKCKEHFAELSRTKESPSSTSFTEKELAEISYCIGWGFSRDLISQGMELDPAMTGKAFSDIQNKSTLAYNEKQISEALNILQEKLAAQKEKQREIIAQKNITSGTAFLASNARTDGVVTLASGLQYKVLVRGDGHSPRLNDTVTVHYRGHLIDGTEFDSSYKRGEPVSFATNGVIIGWTEALQLMHEGDKWQVVIPSELAYGDRGAGPIIGPNATLIFEIELLKVDKQ